MAQDKVGNFEIPAELRNIAERSMEQARQAFEGFVTATNQAVGAIESNTQTAQAGAKDVGKKALTFAERNVAASFELAEKLVRAKDVQEMMRLQAEYVNQQTRALAEQAKELGESASKVAMDSAKPRI